MVSVGKLSLSCEIVPLHHLFISELPTNLIYFDRDYPVHFEPELHLDFTLTARP